MRFWDSSAILPLIVEEQTSAVILDIFQARRGLWVWWANETECVSAVSRLEREGKMSLKLLEEAFKRILSVKKIWNEIQPALVVKDQAQRILRIHPLRAADAFHLAAALIACDFQSGGWQFVCLDANLRKAAAREGFEVIPAEF